MALLPLLFLFGFVSAFNPVTDDATVDVAVKYLNSTLKFKEYIPAIIVSQIEDILKPENRDELQNLVDLHNKFRKGELKITMPHTRDEAMALVKQYAPKTYARCELLLNDFMSKYNQLSPAAKQFYDESEASYYEMHANIKQGEPSSTMANRIVSQIKFFVDQDAKFNALPDSVKTEFGKFWPELMKLMKSPMYQQMMNIMKNTDPNQIGTLIHSMMAVMQQAEQQN